MDKLKELLIESCGIMKEQSVSCVTDFVSYNSSYTKAESGSSCDWYHSVWQYLRVLNCVSAPQWHLDFYNTAFKKAFEDKKDIRILITGTADYSLLHILASLLTNQKNIKATIDIVDLCSTPLKICSWYSSHCFNALGIKRPDDKEEKYRDRFAPQKSITDQIIVNTIKCNITFYKAQNQYDIICTDAFLTRFDKKEVYSVTDKWASLLSDTGRIITTVRVQKSTEDKKKNVASISKDVNTFCSKVISRYNELSPEQKRKMAISPEDLQFMACQYIQRMKSNPIGNADEIKLLFKQSGLSIIEENSNRNAEVEGEISPTTYYRIVAKKLDMRNAKKRTKK